MDWPGNIRELQNMCERLVIFSEECITENDLPFAGGNDRAASMPAFSESMTLKELKEKTEKEYILHHLWQTDWNITKTAAVLGIERSNLHKKIAAYNLSRPIRSADDD